MKLYHYATQHFPQLETLKFQKRNEKRKGVTDSNYANHISFFFDPLDPIVLNEVYGSFHHFWKEGAVVWEHVCESHHFGDFDYHIVETPEKMKILYDDSLSDDMYYRKLDLIHKEHHYLGNQSEFDVAARKFVGHTSKYQKRAPTYKNWEDIKTKYAATVPHVMLYPNKGFVKVESAGQITIGKRR